MIKARTYPKSGAGANSHYQNVNRIAVGYCQLAEPRGFYIVMETEKPLELGNGGGQFGKFELSAISFSDMKQLHERIGAELAAHRLPLPPQTIIE